MKILSIRKFSSSQLSLQAANTNDDTLQELRNIDGVDNVDKYVQMLDSQPVIFIIRVRRPFAYWLTEVKESIYKKFSK